MVDSPEVVCWKCGASISEHPLPLSRNAQCRQCSTDLYVCKLCQFYDTSKAKSCQEPVAEEVRDKERANFCDYLKLRPNAYDTSKEKQQDTAKQRLEALFSDSMKKGDTPKTEQDHREALEKLFKK